MVGRTELLHLHSNVFLSNLFFFLAVKAGPGRGRVRRLITLLPCLGRRTKAAAAGKAREQRKSTHKTGSWPKMRLHKERRLNKGRKSTLSRKWPPWNDTSKIRKHAEEAGRKITNQKRTNNRTGLTVGSKGVQSNLATSLVAFPFLSYSHFIVLPTSTPLKASAKKEKHIWVEQILNSSR